MTSVWPQSVHAIGTYSKYAWDAVFHAAYSLGNYLAITEFCESSASTYPSLSTFDVSTIDCAEENSLTDVIRGTFFTGTRIHN